MYFRGFRNNEDEEVCSPKDKRDLSNINSTSSKHFQHWKYFQETPLSSANNIFTQRFISYF